MAENQVIQLAPPPPLTLDIEASHQTQQWTKYKDNLDLFFTASNIKDEKQKHAMCLYLGGSELREIAETLDPDNKSTYTELTKKLDDHFSTKTNYTFERSKFRGIVPLNDKESSRSYIGRLRKAVVNCKFDEYTNDNACVDQYIEKKATPSFRRKLLSQPDLTLSKLLELATAREVTEDQAKSIEAQSTISDETLNKLQTKQYKQQKYTKPPESSNSRQYSKPPEASSVKQSKPSDKNRCYGCGRSGHFHGSDDCPAMGQKCNFCGIFNHWEVVCQAKQRQGYSREAKKFPNRAPTNSRGIINSAIDLQDTSSEEEHLFSLNHPSDIIIKLDQQPVSFLRDSGATINLIDRGTFQNLNRNKNIELYPTKTNIFTYNAKQPLPLDGLFYANASYKQNHHIAKVFVTSNENSGCILGRDSAVKLGVMKLFEEVNSMQPSSDLSSLLTEFNDLFQGLGLLKNQEIKFEIDSSVQPVTQHLRRIPFHMRVKVENKIKQLLELDVIEKVEGPTSWISPVCAVPKENGDVRITVDMRSANTAIKSTHYPIPTLDELLTKFNACTKFSKIDLLHGYHQILLHKDSRYITAFITHEGIYQYKRLVQGVNTAFSEYQHRIGQLFLNEPLIENIADDILIGGCDKQQHDRNLRRCFEILRKNGLTVNPKKCVFDVSEVQFFGHIIGSEGVKPKPGIVDAIKSFTKPSSTKEVSSFLGLVQYLGSYINNLATATAPLRNLLKKDVKWKWTELEQNCFDKLKRMVSSDLCVAHFKPDLETILITDAGPIGVGAILAQKQIDGKIKAISYGSRALSKQEQKYSQTEREALAVVWACEKYHLFLYGKKFTIYSDHQPLKVIYSPKGKPSPRILRWGLRMQSYEFEVDYIPGYKNPADILSIKPFEKPSKESEKTEQYINSLIAYAAPKAIPLSEIITESQSDEVLKKVIESLISHEWDLSDQELLPYYRVKEELAEKSGILLRGSSIVIPSSLRSRTLSLAHESHQGIVRTKALLREKTWWPGMNNQIEELIKNCVACLSVSKPNVEPMGHNTSPLKSPWEKVHIDLCGPFPGGIYLFGIIDSCSRWPELYITKSTNSISLTNLMLQCFACHGFPIKIITDNAPNLISVDVRNFCNMYGIKHKKSTAYHPQGNAEIERLYRSTSKFIKALTAEGRRWEHELYNFLLTYRNTPHTTTGISPARLLMSRDLRDKIPQYVECKNPYFEQAKASDLHAKQKAKNYYDKRKRTKDSGICKGDFVIMENLKKGKLVPKFEVIPLEVVDVSGSKVTVMKNGKMLSRNSSKFKVVDISKFKEQPRQTGNELEEDDYSDYENSNDSNPAPVEPQQNQQPEPRPNAVQQPTQPTAPRKTQPVRNQVVRYKLIDSNEWEEGTVMTRQPKKTGMYNHWINISKGPDPADELCVNWDRVEDWHVNPQ